MANIKKYQMRRLTIKGGEVQQLQVQGSDINVLRFMNWGQNELRISQHSDPQSFPEVIITGNGGTNNMMDPAGISRVFIYAAADVSIGLVEIQMDDPMLILAMESVVANLLTSLPAGTAHVGSMSIDQGGNPVTAANRLPVDIGATITANNIYTQVTAVPVDASPSDSLVIAGTTDGLVPAAAGANVGWVRVVAGKVWISLQEIAAGVLFDVSDRAARLLGQVGIQIGGADVTAANPVPVKPATGVTPVEVTFAAAETKSVKATPGRVFAIVAKGCDVTLKNAAVNIWFVPAGSSFSFPRPAECATTIQVTSSAAGNAYVEYE